MEPRTLRAWVDHAAADGSVVLQLSISGPDVAENILTVPVTVTKDRDGGWSVGVSPVTSLGPIEQRTK